MKLLTLTDLHRGFSDRTANIHDKFFSRIDRSSFDAILLCGDNGTLKFDNIEGLFKCLRRHFPNILIMTVWGNHDYWEMLSRGDKMRKKRQIRLLEKMNQLEDVAKKYNIHALENNPKLVDDKYLFLGFNGWYHHAHNNTQDLQHIGAMTETGENTDNYLRNLADKAVNFIIDYPKENKTVISVTHFPCISQAMTAPPDEGLTVTLDEDHSKWNGNPMHGDILLEFSDFIFFGHTHHPFDQVIGKSRVINVGNGYTRNNNYKMKYLIVDLSKPHEVEAK